MVDEHGCIPGQPDTGNAGEQDVDGGETDVEQRADPL